MPSRLRWVVVAAALVATAGAGCSGGSSSAKVHLTGSPTPRTALTSDSAVPSPSPNSPAAGPPAAGSLAGRTVVVDPGHNGANEAHPEIINKLVNAGNGVRKPCNTTGTSGSDGFTEAEFNWEVAQRLRGLLQAAGARVILTRDNNTGVGPCITERAAAANNNHADLMLSIHADGAPANDRGFHVITQPHPPVDTGTVAASQRLGHAVVTAYHDRTGLPYANYVGTEGMVTDRGDLGGLNLSTRPAALIECGNMRNPADETYLHSAAGQETIASALATAITTYLTAR
ncbi:MAG: N-acetylmuramoyl-L-alanine amidase [Mycobacteriales bacterium]